jgi:ankyrin repeat protein
MIDQSRTEDQKKLDRRLLKSSCEGISVIGGLMLPAKFAQTAMTACAQLVEAGADIQVIPEVQRQALLMAAVWGNNTDFAIALIRSGIDLHRKEGGELALHCVPNHFNETIYDELVRFGARIDEKCDLGYTLLHNVCSLGKTKFFHKLIKDGADFQVPNQNGMMPIHLAAMHGHGEICRALVELGVDPDVKLLDGRTALFLAAGKGFSQTCFDLIKAGADATLKWQGKTPWGHAGSKRKKTTAIDLKSFVDSMNASRAIDRVLVTNGLQP